MSNFLLNKDVAFYVNSHEQWTSNHMHRSVCGEENFIEKCLS